SCVSKVGLWQESNVNKWIADQDVSIGDQQAKSGAYQVVKLPAEEAKKYTDMAYDALWSLIVKRSPDMGAKARKLLNAE
ncbi:MAG: hypothetical protein RLT05_18110, partial [Bauldia litoralis]